MENTTKKEIVKALIAYMSEHNMTQANVSDRSGVRREYVSIILKPESNFMYSTSGKDGYIPARHFGALAELCGYKIDKVYWETQPTDQMVSILANLEEAKNQGSTAVIVGETGCGKSYTANLFASKHPLDTFIITVGSSDTLGDLIDKVCEKLKINVGKSKSTRLRWIGFKMRDLKHDGNKPMIIFDEAEYMKQAALCAIKELYDYLNEYCSIVLIGTDQLTANVEKLRRKNRAGIPQFFRRIKFGLRIAPNIDRRFEIFLNDFQAKPLRDFFQSNCDNYGELHDVLVPALREADRLKEPINIGLVRRVLNLPHGDLQWQ